MGAFKTQGLRVQFHTYDPSGYGVMLARCLLTQQISYLLIMKSVLDFDYIGHAFVFH